MGTPRYIEDDQYLLTAKTSDFHVIAEAAGIKGQTDDSSSAYIWLPKWIFYLFWGYPNKHSGFFNGRTKIMPELIDLAKKGPSNPQTAAVIALYLLIGD